MYSHDSTRALTAPSYASGDEEGKGSAGKEEKGEEEKLERAKEEAAPSILTSSVAPETQEEREASREVALAEARANKEELIKQVKEAELAAPSVHCQFVKYEVSATHRHAHTGMHDTHRSML